jgi:hypothetical protein
LSNVDEFARDAMRKEVAKLLAGNTTR